MESTIPAWIFQFGGILKKMSRESILRKLARYREVYPEEAEEADRFIKFISGTRNCFHRSQEEGHVTGSAWVVDQTGKKALLTHHRKLGRWLQLGGHADGDPDILSVALREVKEESGLERVKPFTGDIFDIDIHLIPKRGTEEEHFHYDIRFAFENEGSEEYLVSEESHDLSWVDIVNVHHLTTEESMLRMVRKWIGARQAAGCRRT